MRPLSISEVEDFARGPRMYRYRHVNRLAPVGWNTALVIGSAVHAGSEQLRAGLGEADSAKGKVLRDVSAAISVPYCARSRMGAIP